MGNRNKNKGKQKSSECTELRPDCVQFARFAWFEWIAPCAAFCVLSYFYIVFCIPCAANISAIWVNSRSREWGGKKRKPCQKWR